MALLDAKNSFLGHVITLVVVLAVVIACVVRIIRAEMPMMRPDMMALGAGGKSIVLIGYQMISEHTGKLYSVKANVIINVIEVAFWAAVAGMGVMSNVNFCTGDSLTVHCYIGWGINGASVVICVLSMYSLALAAQTCRGNRKGLGTGYDHKRLSSINLTDTQSWNDVPGIPHRYAYSGHEDTGYRGGAGY